MRLRKKSDAPDKGRNYQVFIQKGDQAFSAATQRTMLLAIAFVYRTIKVGASANYRFPGLSTHSNPFPSLPQNPEEFFDFDTSVLPPGDQVLPWSANRYFGVKLVKGGKYAARLYENRKMIEYGRFRSELAAAKCVFENASEKQRTDALKRGKINPFSEPGVFDEDQKEEEKSELLTCLNVDVDDEDEELTWLNDHEVQLSSSGAIIPAAGSVLFFNNFEIAGILSGSA